MSRRALVVAATLVVALGLRVAFVETTSYRAVNDAGTYNRFAAAIATDGDYTTGANGPGTGAGGSRGPTAYFPPGYSYALALADLLDGHSSGHRAALPGERLENAALGTVTVGLVGLVALEMCGAGPALAALVLAAVDPVLIELSGVLVAENLLVVLELAAVWAGLRARGSPQAVAVDRRGGGADRAGDVDPRERGGDGAAAGGGRGGGGARPARCWASTRQGCRLMPGGLRRRAAASGGGRAPGGAPVGPRGRGAAARLHGSRDRAVDGPQRAPAPPLRPGRRRGRDHAARHVQPGLGRRPLDPLQVAAVLVGRRRTRGSAVAPAR